MGIFIDGKNGSGKIDAWPLFDLMVCTVFKNRLNAVRIIFE